MKPIYEQYNGTKCQGYYIDKRITEEADPLFFTKLFFQIEQNYFQNQTESSHSCKNVGGDQQRILLKIDLI